MCRIERSYVVVTGINVVYLRVSPKRPKDLFLIRNVHHHMYPLMKLSAGGRTMAFENEGTKASWLSELRVALPSIKSLIADGLRELDDIK